MPKEYNVCSNKIIWLNAIAIAVVLFQVGHLFYFINRYSVDVPFWDQWDYYNAFFQPHGLWDIFSWQHGPHRQGAGFFLTWAVNELTGWNQRAQSFVIGGVVLLAAITLLWLKKRLFGTLEWYDAIPVLIILSLKQWEIFANTPNVSHGALPLLFILLLCVSWTFRNHIVRYATVLTINFLAIFTGFGLFAGLVTPILVIVDCRHAFRGRKFNHLFVSVCALFVVLASFGLFLHKYQFQPAVAGFRFPDPQWYLYPVFMAIEFGSSILPGHVRSVEAIVGGVAIVCMLAVLASSAVALLRSEEHYRLDQVVFLLLGFSLLFAANAAIGRLCLGLGAATASRYVTLLLPAFIGTYLFLLGSSRWREHLKYALIPLFVVTIFCTIPSWHSSEAEAFRNNKSAWIRGYMLTGDSIKADEVSGNKIYPDSVRTDLDRKLEWLRVHRYSLFRKSTDSTD